MNKLEREERIQLLEKEKLVFLLDCDQTVGIHQVLQIQMQSLPTDFN